MPDLVMCLAGGRRDETMRESSPAQARTPCRDRGRRPGSRPPRAMETGLPAVRSAFTLTDPGALDRAAFVDVCFQLQGRVPAFERPAPIPRCHAPIRMRLPWDDKPCLMHRSYGRFCQSAFKRKSPAVWRRNSWKPDWVGEPLWTGHETGPDRAKSVTLL